MVEGICVREIFNLCVFLVYERKKWGIEWVLDFLEDVEYLFFIVKGMNIDFFFLIKVEVFECWFFFKCFLF